MKMDGGKSEGMQPDSQPVRRLGSDILNAALPLVDVGGTSSQVELVLISVDFDALEADPQLKAEIESAILEAVALHIGDESHIRGSYTVELQKGVVPPEWPHGACSVTQACVNAAPRNPSSAAAATILRLRLLPSVKLSEAVESRLQQLPGIQRAGQGKLGVASAPHRQQIAQTLRSQGPVRPQLGQAGPLPVVPEMPVQRQLAPNTLAEKPALQQLAPEPPEPPEQPQQPQLAERKRQDKEDETRNSMSLIDAVNVLMD